MDMVITSYQQSIIEQVTKFEQVGTGLAHICRFGGRIGWYPVLAHSLVVGTLAAKSDPRFELPGLLHDAVEVLTGDICQPFKTDEQKTLELEIRRELFVQLGLQYPSEEVWDLISTLDDEAGHAEWQLMAPEDCKRRFGMRDADEEVKKLTARYLKPSYEYWLDGMATLNFILACERAACFWRL